MKSEPEFVPCVRPPCKIQTRILSCPYIYVEQHTTHCWSQLINSYSNTGHSTPTVKYSDESWIWVFIIRMVTILSTLNQEKSWWITFVVYYFLLQPCYSCCLVKAGATLFPVNSTDIFWRYLNRYYSKLLSLCYYLSSLIHS